MAQLKKKHTWIVDDSKYFMLKGGKYELFKYDPNVLLKEMNELKARKQVLEKNVNTKAMEALGNKEESVSRKFFN